MWRMAWDGGELRETVQKAAPVRCEGGMLTFIHKTELMARYGDAPQPVGAATQGGVKGSKEWAQVDLRHEDVVRDFLVDLFLEDVEFISEAAFVVAWAERCCKGGYLAGAGGHACDLLLNNVRALLGGALPKRSGGTLLHAAAADGDYFAVSKILEMLSTGLADGALLEQRDDEGRTPLFCAAQSGHAQVAAALVAAGARREMRSKLRPEVHVVLGAERDAVTLEAAARALLEAGAGVNAGTGQRPLIHAAAERGMEEMVRELVEKSTEVDAEDGEGRTALTVALAFGQEAAARALLEAGAGVNAGTGRRPLHTAAERGMEEMVRELVGKGVEVDVEDGEGRTALTVALAFGHEGAARALLEAGAGVNAGTAADVEAEMEARMEKLAELRQEAERETDALCRQELLVRCREEQAALVQASRNVKLPPPAVDKGAELAGAPAVAQQDRAGERRQIDADGSMLDVAETGNHADVER
ncbi:hypothetical protein CYMTET_24431 [Cymbomonas tetramitiformis]|uniref:Uncharacterized protein n=1 Tax=Cymbomonas tetramitiformis TaxID=36881 RepID=A0AAE0FVU0_9CHLO|nr:hypothetical protein CYMTET_24431 [Cymbomonas tetramitiformis]